MSRKMKDSGIEWIGIIPDSWCLESIGQLYTERKQKVSDRDYAPLSVTMKGILPQLSTAAKTDAHDDRKLVKKGDFAINSRSDRRGSCGISAYDGSVSLINTILSPRNEMNPDYYNWLFHTSLFSDEFYKWGHGIVDDLWTTNWQDMKKISVPYPSVSEQQIISSYLDTKCAHIDNIIEKTKASIEEYKKLKQAVITQAVTKGVRGDRPMKDSGIEWIGEIPVEWEVMKSKRVFSSVNDLDHYMPESVDEGYPYLMIGDLSNLLSTVNFDDCKMVSFDDYMSLSKKVKPQQGDIIFTRYATIGTVCYVDIEKEFLVSYACVTIHPDNSMIDGKYVYYFFKSFSFIEEVKRLINSNTQGNVGKESLFNFRITVPTTSEQQDIAAYLDKKCVEIDAIITKKQQFITEMESYKKSMIYEYVTGKREVCR